MMSREEQKKREEKIKQLYMKFIAISDQQLTFFDEWMEKTSVETILEVNSCIEKYCNDDSDYIKQSIGHLAATAFIQANNRRYEKLFLSNESQS